MGGRSDGSFRGILGLCKDCSDPAPLPLPLLRRTRDVRLTSDFLKRFQTEYLQQKPPRPRRETGAVGNEQRSGGRGRRAKGPSLPAFPVHPFHRVIRRRTPRPAPCSGRRRRQPLLRRRRPARRRRRWLPEALRVRTSSPRRGRGTRAVRFPPGFCARR